MTKQASFVVRLLRDDEAVDLAAQMEEQNITQDEVLGAVSAATSTADDVMEMQANRVKLVHKGRKSRLFVRFVNNEVTTFA